MSRRSSAHRMNCTKHIFKIEKRSIEVIRVAYAHEQLCSNAHTVPCDSMALPCQVKEVAPPPPPVGHKMSFSKTVCQYGNLCN